VDRRAFLAAVTGGLLAAPFAVEAQPAGKISRIGYLTGGSAETDKTLLAAFQQGLAALGYVEGKSIAIEQRFAAGQTERLPELAAELVQSKVDVILVTATAVYETRAVLAEVPTVFVIADDPVKGDLWPALPGLQLQTFQVPSMDQLPRAIDAATQSRVEALMVLSSPVFRGYQAQTAQLVARTRLPVVSAWREFPEAGGLLSYGTNVSAMFRRAAVFVDKILTGARPGDLPIEQPTQFELVINLKTAKTLGLTIPPSLLHRADQVIE
jgi:putative ABC transport system substrate-binding protein